MADEENCAIKENDLSPDEVNRNKKPNALSVSSMDDILSRRKDLPDDLACFLQQQKQRQARLETTMRSFGTEDMEQDKSDFKKKRNAHEDPMSHRIIEKRRRDRMNNCLADLSRLIPSSYLKKGRGRIEKTEIIEMAIKHIRHLQRHPCTKQEGCELASEIQSGLDKASSVESFRVGYHECLTEIMHFLVEREGLYSGNSFCVRLMSHLQKHFDKLGRASTSEVISTPGRAWKASNSHQDHKEESQMLVDKENVKSEFGVGSEESGYKTDEASCLASAAQDDVGSHPRWPPEPDPCDLPSDLSVSAQTKDNKLTLGDDLTIPVTGASLYKFKSNIRHRFDSARSVDDDKDVINVGKRTRLDSTSTDVDQSYDDFELRRECLSPTLGSSHVRHRSGPGIDLSTSPLPGPSTLPKQYIPVFALSNNGAYYVPLSVEADNLLPFLPSLAENAPGPFHPVTISVKFAPFLNPSTSSSVQVGEGQDSESWRNVKRGGVIHAPQSVIKQNWRDGGPI